VNPFAFPQIQIDPLCAPPNQNWTPLCTPKSKWTPLRNPNSNLRIKQTKTVLFLVYVTFCVHQAEKHFSRPGVSNSNCLMGRIRLVNNSEGRMKSNLGLLGRHQTCWRAILITIISLLNIKCNEMRACNWKIVVFFWKNWNIVIFSFYLDLNKLIEGPSRRPHVWGACSRPMHLALLFHF
jgi:hypothetical protein